MSQPSVLDGSLTRETRMLREAVDRCVDALTSVAFRAEGRAGWLAWELSTDGDPVEMRGGRPGVYDGDAGVAWALVQLAEVTCRTELLELAADAVSQVAHQAAWFGGGLLTGRAGVRLAGAAVERVTGSLVPGLELVAGGLDDVTGTDLTDGVAGVLLGLVRAQGGAGDRRVAMAEGVRRLGLAARPEPVGLSWVDPSISDPVAGRPLCGMAHGNSGIALALAEVAAAEPVLRAPASFLAAEALRWEAVWFDPVTGGWPDLREEPSYPTMWCHGSAGIGAVRLRLLALAENGLDLGVPLETVQAEAEAAVSASGRLLAQAASGRLGSDGLVGGLTLCHGLGGALDVLTLAHELWGVREHLDAARSFALAILDQLDEDPLTWPAGVRADGGVSLFLGLSGAAVVLARLAYPGAGLDSPSLLGGLR